jgi:regulator of sirC expression with transglutaminase-like and TPR domain
MDRSVLAQVKEAADRLAPEVARRVEELAYLAPRRYVVEDLAALVEAGGEDMDLEAGLWCLARIRDPDLVTAPYTRELERLAEAVRRRISTAEPSRDVLEVFIQVLFQEEGFRGNFRDYYDPDNSFFHKVLERRQGIPVSLSALCILVGRRVGLPLEGIGLPGHFICRFGAEEEALYFDPFHDGRLLTRQGCVALVRQAGFLFRDAYLCPSTNREILVRMVRNLRDIYLQREGLLEVSVLEDCLYVLNRPVEEQPAEEEDELFGEEPPDEVG